MAELEKEIQDYMEGHNICTIALSESNNPSAHTVYYVCKDFRLYFESTPKSEKVRIIQSNPKVSVAIDEDYSDWHKIKGIQLFGKARIIDFKNAPHLEAEFHKKFPHLNDMGGIPENHVFIEVIPEKIYFLDFTKELGHRSTFFPKELGQGFLSKVNW